MIHEKSETGVLIRQLEAPEYAVLEDFYRRFLPNGDRVVAVFRWRGSHRSASGGNQAYGGFLDGKLVGVVNTVPMQIQGFGRSQEARWYTDTLVAPQARGMGLARRLVRCATETAPLLLVKGSNAVMYRLRTSLGFRDVPNDQYLMCPIRLTAPGAPWRFRLALPALKVISTFRTRKPRRTDLEFTRVDRFGPWYDELSERLRDAPYFGTNKTSAFLNWRYIDNPLRSYVVFEARFENETMGAFVVRSSERSDESLWLVDVLAPLTDQNLIAAILWECVKKAHAWGVPTIRTFASSILAGRQLAKVGFIPSGSTPHFTYFTNSAPPDVLPPGVDWNFWHGDSDNEFY